MTPAPPAQRGRRLPSWLVGTGVIAVAMAVMNVTTYGFTILAARILGPAEYGALAAVMGLLLVVNVVSLGLQATGARRVSASPGTSPASRTTCMLGDVPVGRRLAPADAASPRRWSLVTLNLDSWLVAALVRRDRRAADRDGRPGRHPPGRAPVGPAGRASTWASAWAGIAFGGLALVVGPHRPGRAPSASTVGAVVPVVVGWCALRHPQPGAAPARPWRPGDAGPALGPRRACCARRVRQLPRAARVLRALQRGRDHRPQHPARAPGGPVRRRADPREGGAVPAAVRGGDRVPVDVRQRVGAPDAPGGQPRPGRSGSAR